MYVYLEIPNNAKEMSYVQKHSNSKFYKGIKCRINAGSGARYSYSNSLSKNINDKSNKDHYDHFNSYDTVVLKGQWQKIPKQYKELNFSAVVECEQTSVTHIFKNGFHIIINEKSNIQVNTVNIVKYIKGIDMRIINYFYEYMGYDDIFADNPYIGKIYNVGKPFTLEELNRINTSKISCIALLWIEQERKKIWRKLYVRLLAATKYRKN